MKKVLKRISAAVFSAVILAAQIPFASAKVLLPTNSQNGEVIVAFKSAKNTSVNLGNVQITDTITIGGKAFSLVKSGSYSTSQLKSKIAKLKNVKSVQDNTRFKLTDTDEDYQAFQWALDNKGQTGGTDGADIGASKIYDSGVKSGDKVVAIVDSGIDASHSDLKDNIWQNEYQRDLEGSYGYDFRNDDAIPDDVDGHGTHCAGIITAADDKSGVKGVNSDVKIMPLKAFEGGYGDMFDILCAYSYIYRAKELGVDVVAINNSWGGLDTEANCTLIKTAIDALGEKGIISVFAAGNDGVDGYSQSGDKSIPLDIDSDYILKVGSVNDKDNVSVFSNYGKDIDVYAPGENILSDVNYACYNPTIYSTAKKSQVNAQFTDFDKISDFTDTSENELGVKTLSDEGATGKVSVTKDASLGFLSGSSLKWSIKGASKGDVYTLYLPYTSKNAATAAQTMYLSFMMRTSLPDIEYDGNILDVDGLPLFTISDSAEENANTEINLESSDMVSGGYLTSGLPYWDHFSFNFNQKVKAGSDRAIVIRLQTNTSGDYTFDFDDLGLSKPIKASEAANKFGKYDYYNGTSMAAPYVAGSVALIDKYYKNASAKKIVAAIKGSVRKLSDKKAASKGALDLRNIDNPTPYITDSTSALAAITVKGNFFGDKKGKVYINNSEVAADKITWNNSQIKADASKYINKNVSVKLVTESGVSAESNVFVQGKTANYSAISSLDGWANFKKAVSDGSNIYLLDEFGGFTKAHVSAKAVDYTELNAPDKSKLFADSIAKGNLFTAGGDDSGDALGSLYGNDFDDGAGSENMTFTSELVYQNGKIWAVAKYLGNHYSYYKLISYTISTNKWAAETELPTDKTAANYTDSTLGIYKGKLYLMGGYNASTDSVTDMVRVYDPTAKKWSNGAPLPSGRFKSTAYQVDSKLVVMFGGDGNNGMPKTAVFDGKTWSEKSAPPISFEDKGNYLSLDNYGTNDPELHDRYYTAQAGVAKNGLAVISENCEGLGNTYFYNLSSDKFSALSYTKSVQADGILAASVGGRLVSVYTKAGLLSVKNIFSYVPIASACYTVSRKTQNCKVTGNSHYFAGDHVTVTVKPNKNCYFKALYVNGKKVKGKSYSFTANQNVKLTAVCGAYVTKIKLDKKTAKVKAGDKIKLKAKVTPKKATNKKIKWTSSDKKVATVTAKGVVKTNSNAKGKKVRIIARTVDGSKKKAVCTIKVV